MPDTVGLMDMAEVDIAVLGAGPAGCLAARLLRGRGYDVAVVSTPRAYGTVEGLSDRVIELLSTYGCQNALSAVGPRVDRVSSWNGTTEARNQETVVDRSAFDAGLLADACDHGVVARRGRIGRIHRRPDHIAIDYRTPGGNAATLRCRYMVEARGRRAPHPRGRAARGPETTALTRKVNGVPRQPQTVVAACPDGWLWYVTAGDGAGYLQLFLDSGAGKLPRRAALDAYFDDHVAALDLPNDLIPDGRAASQPVTRNATAWLAKDLIGESVIRIGDAAVAVDPLSGHGTFEAFGSALAAAAAVHTILCGSGDGALARTFYIERECDAFWRYSRVGRDFYRLETRWPENSFWRARAVWPDDVAAHAGPRTAPPRVERKPVIENGLVVAREVCVTPDHPRGVWRIAGVPVIDLARLVAQRAEDNLAELRQTAAVALDVDPDRVNVALDWLRYREIMIEGPPRRVRMVGLQTEYSPFGRPVGASDSNT